MSVSLSTHAADIAIMWALNCPQYETAILDAALRMEQAGQLTLLNLEIACAELFKRVTAGIVGLYCAACSLLDCAVSEYVPAIESITV